MKTNKLLVLSGLLAAASLMPFVAQAAECTFQWGQLFTLAGKKDCLALQSINTPKPLVKDKKYELRCQISGDAKSTIKGTIKIVPKSAAKLDTSFSIDSSLKSITESSFSITSTVNEGIYFVMDNLTYNIAQGDSLYCLPPKEVK